MHKLHELQIEDDGRYNVVGFRELIEDFRTDLRHEETTEELEVSAADAYRYSGDLFGLLTAYSIPARYQWVVMRVNNYLSPLDYHYTDANPVIPSFDRIDALHDYYRTQKKTYTKSKLQQENT